MLKDIKEKLITNTDALIELLEDFGFEKITARVSEIRCARDADGGGNNIQIRLNNNDGVYVTDYARGTREDIIAYLMKEKGVDFRTVVQSMKKILNLSDDWASQKKVSLFGGWYDSVGRKVTEVPVKTYPETILEQYDMCPNERWIKDGITIEAQRFYQVGYDTESQRIIFPIRSAETGEIVMIKGRRNYSTEDESDPKYIYLVPGPMSQTLYNYAESYGELYNNEVWVVESEKSVMLMYGFGYRNVVALGSHSLSEKQAQLLLQLNPKRIIMALDEGLPFEETERNLKLLQTFTALRDLEFWYWDSTIDQSIKNTKVSPCDLGQEYFEKVKNEQLKRWELIEKKETKLWQ